MTEGMDCAGKEMLPESNSPMAVDSGDLGAPTKPEDADGRLQAAWLAKVSKSAAAKQIPEQDSGSTDVPQFDRQLGEEFPFAPASRFGLITMVSVGTALVLAAVVVTAIPRTAKRAHDRKIDG
jgi:hypothetical protein